MSDTYLFLSTLITPQGQSKRPTNTGPEMQVKCNVLFMEAATFRIAHTAAFPPGARGTLLGVMSQYLGSSHVQVLCPSFGQCLLHRVMVVIQYHPFLCFCPPFFVLSLRPVLGSQSNSHSENLASPLLLELRIELLTQKRSS